MKKHILNLGTPLNREQQRSITGGKKQCIVPVICNDPWGDCPPATCSEYGLQCAELECQLLPL
ncbi:hypothetical protein ED312_00370 [Sinomicrobium pectinilyticum]|uniref:Bacteriocin n=1 Tax=Sinomicrobium pectinilyticum TaxID=1084421 RepID=A0A3N0F4P2_SINP1|nr:hypothetical protein [Sinomicrobium pectinilyticum]RNL95094.1 hypothetical protein ED312_00370 [Sinomicrobium pectinilyticum]